LGSDAKFLVSDGAALLNPLLAMDADERSRSVASKVAMRLARTVS